jgi:hypothetical protein
MKCEECGKAVAGSPIYGQLCADGKQHVYCSVICLSALLKKVGVTWPERELAPTGPAEPYEIIVSEGDHIEISTAARIEFRAAKGQPGALLVIVSPAGLTIGKQIRKSKPKRNRKRKQERR